MNEISKTVSIDELALRIEEYNRAGRSSARGLDIPSIRRFVDDLETPVFLETLGGRVLSCNRAACDIYGYSPEDVCNLSVFDLVPIEIAKLIPDMIVQQLHEKGMKVQAMGKHKSGHVFPTEVETRLIDIGKEKRVLVLIHLTPDTTPSTE